MRGAQKEPTYLVMLRKHDTKEIKMKPGTNAAEHRKTTWNIAHHLDSTRQSAQRKDVLHRQIHRRALVKKNRETLR